MRMRDPVGAEVLLLARCLIAVTPAARRALATRLVEETDLAADHLRQTGSLHPQFGDGSLMARCHRLSPPPEPRASDPAFLQAIGLASQVLLQHFRS